jgi:purine-binding chemotaxis protein CheW
MAVVAALDRFVLCRVASGSCAFPVQQVIETMRPLGVVPVAGAPPFVRGVAVIRGAAVPVVDVASLMGNAESRPTRFLTMRGGDRCVALAVDAVVGVREFPSHLASSLPPLLSGTASTLVASIGVLDATLLALLNVARVVPDDVWDEIGARGEQS